ncbi:MAG TPA: hypothetical protein VMW30_03145 [Candidatus Paceibacterota bacterium]|nr:hypothetical protein [Candidatus Paceibacterota bacterium]
MPDEGRPLTSEAELAPIFLHTGWRTGGTALSFAFREQPECTLFYEPINIALRNPEKAFLASPGKWDSRHPSSAPYFNEFKKFLTEEGSIQNFPNLDLFAFDSPSPEWRYELARYLHMLVDHAQQEGKIPVFKFTNLEGHVDFLRSEFPSSTNIAVGRGRQDQLLSWFSQAANRNYEFFKAGSKMIGTDQANAFIGKLKLKPLTNDDIASLVQDFNQYRDLVDDFHKKMDAVIDISPEVTFDPKGVLEFVAKNHSPQLAIWNIALDYLIKSRVPISEEDDRLQRAYIQTILKDREIDLKESELALKNREIANLQAQHQRLISSRSWRITAPLRRITGLLKKGSE